MSIGRKLNPKVDKKILILAAGVMWCGVGVMLVSYAAIWLASCKRGEQILYYGLGFLAAMPIHHFGFLRIADRNLSRLLQLEEKKCLFSFITWKSYIIVGIMIAMGITLRHSFIPKRYLSVLYNGIGLALFLSGLRYFRNSVKLFLA
jgi:hypothetical protein